MPTNRQRLLAAIKGNPELVDRLMMVADEPTGKRVVACPEDALGHFLPLLAGYADERLAVMALDRRNRVLAVEVLTVGSDGFTIVDPRQIFRWALTVGRRPAVSVILAHNHPSGDPTPSRQDQQVTDRVIQAANTIGIRVLDHMIVCSPTVWSSMANNGQVATNYESRTMWTG